MVVGEDFEKIHFDFLGLDLVEPNTFITDVFVLVVALIIAQKIKNLGHSGAFYSRWRLFFIVFGLGFFIGGLGHLFYEYWGVPGKYASWYLGIISSFLIERAMISIYMDAKWKKRLTALIQLKLIIALVCETLVFVFVNLEADPWWALQIPTINSFIGLVFALGYLGWVYAKKYAPEFRNFWISVLIMLPIVFVQGMKINLHPWIDRNDLSHFLLIAAMIYYYKGVLGYKNYRLMVSV